MPTKNLQRVAAYLRPDIYKLLCEYCDRSHMSMSLAVAQIISAYFQTLSPQLHEEPVDLSTLARQVEANRLEIESLELQINQLVCAIPKEQLVAREEVPKNLSAAALLKPVLLRIFASLHHRA